MNAENITFYSQFGLGFKNYWCYKTRLGVRLRSGPVPNDTCRQRVHSCLEISTSHFPDGDDNDDASFHNTTVTESKPMLSLAEATVDIITAS